MPPYVERELRAYLECGVLAHGFVRARCPACGESRIVAFSASSAAAVPPAWAAA